MSKIIKILLNLPFSTFTTHVKFHYKNSGYHVVVDNFRDNFVHYYTALAFFYFHVVIHLYYYEYHTIY